MPLLRGLLPRLHNFEHLLLTDPLHLRQRHAELRRLLRALVFDLAAQRFRIIARLVPVQEVLRRRRG